ncbi:MAG: hypothetical protein ACJ8F7_20200, partial [Gemmataceae bacterium]
MKQVLFLLPMLGLALPGIAIGQPGGGSSPGAQRPGGPGGGVPLAVRVDSRGMYEDIEVMRRILATQLHTKS